MKTALDLPDDLVKQVKLIAVHRGMKLKEVFAYLIKRGIDSEDLPAEPLANIGRDALTGLPVVIGRSTASRGMTPDAIAEILIEQEAGWALDAARH